MEILIFQATMHLKHGTMKSSFTDIQRSKDIELDLL